MHRNRMALAVVVLAGLIATGCGSDDPEPSSDKKPEAKRVEKAEPKPNSARAQMIECIEGELGYDVTADDDNPHKLSLNGPNDKLQGVVVVHSNAADARRAVAKTLGEDGLNAVVFGRAEFIRHAAGDTETGVIANCVAAEYNRPG